MTETRNESGRLDRVEILTDESLTHWNPYNRPKLVLRDGGRGEGLLGSMSRRRGAGMGWSPVSEYRSTVKWWSSPRVSRIKV